VQITSGSVGAGLVDLRFQSAGGRDAAWVGCRGRVIWKSEDRTVVGIEFVDTTPLTNREIKDWLSFGQSLRELRREWAGDQASPTHWTEDISREDAPTLAVPVEHFPQNAAAIEKEAPEDEPEQLHAQPVAFGQSYEAAMPRFRFLQIAAVVLVILVGAVVLLKLSGWNFRNIVSKTAPPNQSVVTDHAAESHDANTAVSAPQPIGPSPVNSPATSPANSPAAGSAPPAASAPPHAMASIASLPANSGLMLQAGAMADEQNAKEMAQSLQQKHFPAFVYKKESDRFYRVFIGPYASDQTLTQAQEALRRLNISTIKKKSAS
jgi:cell division septation protein DedD